MPADGGHLGQKKISTQYWSTNANPFRTLPKDAPTRGKDQPRSTTSTTSYSDRGNYANNNSFRGRGTFSGGRGGMNQGNYNRNFGNNMGYNNMGGGFGGPNNNNSFGFNNRGNLMGGGMRGNPGMRGGRGGNMMNMNPMGGMGGMGMGMPGSMGMGMMGGPNGMPGKIFFSPLVQLPFTRRRRQPSFSTPVSGFQLRGLGPAEGKWGKCLFSCRGRQHLRSNLPLKSRRCMLPCRVYLHPQMARPDVRTGQGFSLA
jgi:hypothetical protein